MEYVYDYSDVSLMIVKNVFSKNELKKILDECNYINEEVGLDTSNKVGSATYEDGTYKKKNYSIYLDELVTSRGRYMSYILKTLDKKIYDSELIDRFTKINPSNILIKNTNKHFTLLNYYEENNHYDFHSDANIFTIIYVVYEEPKSFFGGDLIFKINDKEINIPCENNIAIVFPSAYEHKVTSVSMNKDQKNRMMGRFSFVQFLNIVQR